MNLIMSLILFLVQNLSEIFHKQLKEAKMKDDKIIVCPYLKIVEQWVLQMQLGFLIFAEPCPSWATIKIYLIYLLSPSKMPVFILLSYEEGIGQNKKGLKFVLRYT